MPKEVQMTTAILAKVEERLDDIGLTEREHGPEIRPGARAYYLGLIEEELANSDNVLIDDCIDSLEGMTMGFVAGYEACLKAQA